MFPSRLFRTTWQAPTSGSSCGRTDLGSISGAVLDCAAAGLPTVTNISLGDAVGVPAAYFRKIPDALSPVLLAEALADLLEAGLPAQRPEADRHAYSQSRSFRNYTRLLCDALELDLPADARQSA